MRTCQKCGAGLEKGDKYCPDCGAKLKAKGETKKITVWIFLKVIGVIIFFIIFANILRYQPPVAILLLILFLIWTGILNAILKKSFNAEISTGVKVIITVAIVGLFLVGFAQEAQMPRAKMERVPELRYVAEEIDLQRIIEKMNRVVEYRDYGALEEMLKTDMVSQEVFKDIVDVLGNSDVKDLSFKLRDKNLNEKSATVLVRIKTDYVEREETTRWFFEKTSSGWRLFAIKPRLSDFGFSKSFEEEAEHRIETISEPIVVATETLDTSRRF